MARFACEGTRSLEPELAHPGASARRPGCGAARTRGRAASAADLPGACTASATRMGCTGPGRLPCRPRETCSLHSFRRRRRHIAPAPSARGAAARPRRTSSAPRWSAGERIEGAARGMGRSERAMRPVAASSSSCSAPTKSCSAQGRSRAASRLRAPPAHRSLLSGSAARCPSRFGTSVWSSRRFLRDRGSSTPAGTSSKRRPLAWRKTSVRWTLARALRSRGTECCPHWPKRETIDCQTWSGAPAACPNRSFGFLSSRLFWPP
jgi:hypothetical protein